MFRIVNRSDKANVENSPSGMDLLGPTLSRTFRILKVRSIRQDGQLPARPQNPHKAAPSLKLFTQGVSKRQTVPNRKEGAQTRPFGTCQDV